MKKKEIIKQFAAPTFQTEAGQNHGKKLDM